MLHAHPEYNESNLLISMTSILSLAIAMTLPSANRLHSSALRYKNLYLSHIQYGPGGSSGKALVYGLDDLGSIPGVGGVEIFLHYSVSRLALGSTEPPIK